MLLKLTFVVDRGEEISSVPLCLKEMKPGTRQTQLLVRQFTYKVELIPGVTVVVIVPDVCVSYSLEVRSSNVDLISNGRAAVVLIITLSQPWNSSPYGEIYCSENSFEVGRCCR